MNNSFYNSYDLWLIGRLHLWLQLEDYLYYTMNLTVSKPMWLYFTKTMDEQVSVMYKWEKPSKQLNVYILGE